MQGLKSCEEYCSLVPQKILQIIRYFQPKICSAVGFSKTQRHRISWVENIGSFRKSAIQLQYKAAIFVRTLHILFIWPYGYTTVLFIQVYSRTLPMGIIWAYHRILPMNIQPYSSYRYGQCHTIFSSCPSYNNLAYNNGCFLRIHYSCSTVTTRPNSSKKENVQKHAFLELASEVSPF